MANDSWRSAFITLLFASGAVFAAEVATQPVTSGSFPTSGSIFAPSQGPDILPVDEAFRLSAKLKDGAVQLYWQITPGYYLYRHRLKATSDTVLGDLLMVPGEARFDEYFGDVEVYYEALEVEVPVLGATDSLHLTVEYQGCADAGICYPPQKIQLSP